MLVRRLTRHRSLGQTQLPQQFNRYLLVQQILSQFSHLMLEIKLDIPEVPNPVHAKGKIMWKKKLSLEDNAPFDIGAELLDIEEDNKNTFLKFLCDLIYNLPEGKKDAKNRRA